MLIAPLHRHFRPHHLALVSAQMAVLGAPVLRAFFDPSTGAWLAREGSHRLRAAHRLGLVPRLVMTPWWRSLAALERARYAAAQYGLVFPT